MLLRRPSLLFQSAKKKGGTQCLFYCIVIFLIFVFNYNKQKYKSSHFFFSIKLSGFTHIHNSHAHILNT